MDSPGFLKLFHIGNHSLIQTLCCGLPHPLLTSVKNTFPPIYDHITSLWHIVFTYTIALITIEPQFYEHQSYKQPVIWTIFLKVRGKNPCNENYVDEQQVNVPSHSHAFSALEICAVVWGTRRKGCSASYRNLRIVPTVILRCWILWTPQFLISLYNGVLH